MNLKDKTIVITGASDGIGKQIALSLGTERTNLVLIGRNIEKLEDTKKQALSKGAYKVEVYSCDISKLKAIKDTVDKIVDDFGSVDILINNAGIWQKLMPLEEIDDDTIESVIQINLTGLIHMTKQVLPIIKRQPEGAIINISSKAGIVGQQGLSVYNASKFGVTGFTEALKADLKGSSVRVAGVYQAGVNTKMFENTGEDFSVKKFTDPSDLANVVKFMLMQPPKIWLHDVRVEY